MKQLLFSFSFFIILSVTAQQKDVEFIKENFPELKKELKAAIKEIEKGDEFYDQGPAYYSTALPYFLSAQEFNPNSAQLNYKIGNCYVLGSSEKSKAIKYFETAYKLDQFVKLDINYMLGLANQKAGNIDVALKYFTGYKANFTPSFYVKYMDMVDARIRECNNAKELMKKPIRVFIDNMGPVVNSKFPEYGGIINGDESVMLFTSRRDNSTGGMIDKSFNTYYEDIYKTENINGKWSEPVNMGNKVNSNFHDGVVGFSPDGQKLLIYRGDGDLYECRLKGTEWSRPRKIGGYVNTEQEEKSATYSPDGKILYFTSNRYDDNVGGFDIFYSFWNEKEQEWGPSKNLSKNVNSKYDEDGVFMHADGKTLYFSSNGHNTMGGYDIFKTVRQEDGTWSIPENIGYPVNSTDDDVFFSLSASGKRGYYMQVSEKGYGDRDLYEITFLGPERAVAMSRQEESKIKTETIEPPVAVSTTNLTILTGIIRDAISKTPLEATVDIVDNSSSKLISQLISNSSSGKYLVTLPSGKNYGIAVSAKGYLFHSENFDIPLSAAYQKVEKNIDLNKIEIGSKIILKNIFFDTGKHSLRSESNSELERLLAVMKDNSSLKIEISGHTDNVGSEQSNQVLSQNRARVVVEYLTNKGVSVSRMTAMGYGESQPIAPNDTPENRQENRRTEFKITGK